MSLQLQWLVQEQPVLCVLDHPFQTLVEVSPGHGTARQYRPSMCLDGIQTKALGSFNISRE